MADVKISALPAASTPLDGTELVPIVQGGVTEQVTVANLTAGRTVAAGRVTVDANTASDAVRITQTGTGNALVVEDSANPDATPFVIGPEGEVRIGFTGSVPVGSGIARQFQSIVLGDPPGGSGGASFSRFSNDASGAVFAFGKSRGTSASQFTVVSNSDSLGAIRWAGSDGTDLISQAAEIRADVDGTPGNDDMPGRLVFSTTADGASSPTERMRITNAGNVGIGTSAPTGTLQVTNNTGNSSIRVAAVSGTSATLELNSGVFSQINATGGSQFGVLVNGAERMRIDASGNVGIGTSSPLNRLDVSGSFGRGAPVTKTGNFTLAATENWIICNGAGTITVTFPAASLWTGREVMIKTIAAQTVVSASSNVVPLAGGAAGTAILAATAGAWATLVSDGTNWIIMQA